MNKLTKAIIIVITIGLLIGLSGIIYLLFIQEDKVAVLTFHNIEDKITEENTVNISTAKFEKYIKWLSKHGYTSLSIDEFYEWKEEGKKIPRKSILITFDDGWESFYQKAIPILEKYNMKATAFVIWKYTEQSTVENNGIYMTINEIEDIQKNHPTITIASHSHGLHIKELAMSNNYETYDKDLKYVKNTYGDNIKYYAYPFGGRTDNYIKALKDNNYLLSFTFGPYNFARVGDDSYQIPRMGIFEPTQDWKFKLKMLLEI